MSYSYEETKELFKGLFALVIVIPLTLLKAYIMFQIWGWFMYPQLKYYLTYPTCLGIGFVWALMTMNGNKVSKDYSISTGIMVLLMTWGMAYLIKVWFL